MTNASKDLADEYRRLGGRRVAVIDDNLGSSRDWEGDTPEAAKFWKERISSFPDRERRDVETFLPSLNDESDEPEGADVNVEKIIFPVSEWVPNNQRLPVLVYKNALSGASASDDFEELFASNGWSDIWRNGVFDYQHYHSGAHEVLGIGQGSATLLIGGPEGRPIQVETGDCLILPAGTGHMNLGCSSDFEVVGAYPVGQDADIQTSAPSKEMLARISELLIPENDPVQGMSGPLLADWHKQERDVAK